MEKEFFEKTPFLNHYQAIKEFAKLFCEGFLKNSDLSYSVVCERKEDIISVRNQLFYEINLILNFDNNINSTLCGISMYTLDELARNFCATIASTTEKNILNEIPNFIFKPYLDITTQEKLVEYILYFYGYFNNDALPIAKQILSFIDFQWPEDYNFAKLLINTQNKENINTVQEINESSSRQILATYHYALYELNNYCRLQNLVTEYLQFNYIKHIQEINKNPHLNFVLPNKFLSGNILWISAPEFNTKNNLITNKTDHENTIKPGNFQRYFIEEFKNYILKTKDILYKNNSYFYNSRFIISETNIELKNNNISFYVAENKHCFVNKVEELQNEKNNFILLGDFNPGKLCEIDVNGNGAYPISQQFFNAWKNNDKNFTKYSEIFPQIDKHYNDFIEHISLITNENYLKNIGNVYNIVAHPLSINFLEELFKKIISKEAVNLGLENIFASLPKVLSLFSCKHNPNKLIIIGRIHSPTSSSFQVKVLNNAISLLKKQNIKIDHPASEIMYRGFWKNLISHDMAIDFYLESISEIDNFPSYLKPQKNIIKFGKKFIESPAGKIIKKFSPQNENKLINDWRKYLNTSNNKISITSFERYINCPLQFFLSEVIGIKKNQYDILKSENEQIGISLHFLAEQFMTRLVSSLGNANYAKVMLPIYNDIIQCLKNEQLFLSSKKEIWVKAIYSQIEKHGTLFENSIKLAFEEALQIIWQPINLKNMSDFNLAQFREVVKRTFYRFLKIEAKLAENLTNCLTGIERERPVNINLGGVNFSGKIDRIDATPNGLHIIDYKTTQISKTEKKLALLPSDLKTCKSSKLSVQGGLYCLAWSKHHLLDDEDYRNSIHSFSLFQLKNLDDFSNPILSYSFTPKLTSSEPIYNSLLQEYSEYALRLKDGNFYPNPLNTKTCDFCDFNKICPAVVLNNVNSDGDSEENE